MWMFVNLVTFKRIWVFVWIFCLTDYSLSDFFFHTSCVSIFCQSYYSHWFDIFLFTFISQVHIKDLLTQTCHIDADENAEIIVYDQCTEEASQLTGDNFLVVLLHKLSSAFKSVTLLKGKQKSSLNLLQKDSYVCYIILIFVTELVNKIVVSNWITKSNKTSSLRMSSLEGTSLD